MQLTFSLAIDGRRQWFMNSITVIAPKKILRAFNNAQAHHSEKIFLRGIDFLLTIYFLFLIFYIF